MTNFLITGLPRSGKTTLIKKILHIPSIKNVATGFITEEFKRSGERIGFHILTIPDGKKGILAQKGRDSPFRVGSYGVDIQLLEILGCEALFRAVSSDKLIIVDEIGKMELFSDKFRSVLADILDSPQKVLATIMERSHPFTDRIKRRSDIRLVHLTRKNFDEVRQGIINWLDNG